jgi:mannose/fructose/N-acetylgalactosamine-specific phosphotransferase system component IIB
VSLQLLRIDERLIHGQVVVGWGAELRPDRIIVVDDDLAGAEWEQELYVLGLPPTITADFVGVSDARQRLEEWDRSPERIIVLTRDSVTMLALARGGALTGREVNLGGLHHAPGRRQVLPYVYLSNEETEALRALAQEGVDVSASDLPRTRRVGLQQLVEGAGDP